MSRQFFYLDDEDIHSNETVNIRRTIRDSYNPLELESKIFIQNFRLSKEAFSDLLAEIEDKLKIIKSDRAVPNIIKLAAVLKFCAQGSYQLSVGNDFNLGMSQPTVSVVFSEVFDAMESVVCSKYIKFEYSEQDERSAKMYFFEKSGIPNVIGCLDGTHIKIIRPREDIRHLYYNRKGFCSLNVLIVCDHRMYIRYVNGKYPGSYQDSHIWNLSALKAKFENEYRSRGTDFRLLGDLGYPLASYLLTPYRNTEDGSLQAQFNKKHAQGRNIVERTIGLLKSRFRCLLSARELHYSPQKATQIINVCVALHNICVKYNIQHEIPNEGTDVNIFVENEEINDNDNVERESSRLNEARRLRDELLRFM